MIEKKTLIASILSKLLREHNILMNIDKFDKIFRLLSENLDKICISLLQMIKYLGKI